MEIRLAIKDDLVSINDIYNQSIKTGFSTCDTESITLNQRKVWFTNHNPLSYPIFTAIIDKVVVGWISLSAYRSGRKALEKTVEVSYFIDENFQSRGIGSKLMTRILSEAKNMGYKNVFAILLDTNIVSISLLEKFDFKKWGHLPNVAEINGNEVGQFYFGIRL